jgi:hypothetical protein
MRGFRVGGSTRDSSAVTSAQAAGEEVVVPAPFQLAQLLISLRRQRGLSQARLSALDLALVVRPRRCSTKAAGCGWVRLRCEGRWWSNGSPTCCPTTTPDTPEWLDLDVTEPGQVHRLMGYNPRGADGPPPSMSDPLILRDHRRLRQTLQAQDERLGCFPSAVCPSPQLRVLQPLEASDLEVA